jgi:dihydropyrimidine dehydrogenase (NAD+) subunit PreA
MADLRVNFAGVTFKNPLVLASATPGWDGEGMKRAALAGIGGVVPKTIGPVQDWAAHPRNGRLQLIKNGSKAIGMVNLELFTTKTREDWIKEDLAIAKQGVRSSSAPYCRIRS